MKQAVLNAGLAAWRALPKEFRRNALTGAAAALAPKPDQNPPTRSNGVIVAGDMASPNGLAESARLYHRVIEDAGLARGIVPLGLPTVVAMSAPDVPRDAALLAVVNAPILPVGLLRMKRNFIAGRRVIGVWAWELPVVPKQWHYGVPFVHEIWAPSQFTADAIETIAPGRVRVVPIPLAAFDLTVTGTRATFGLPEDVVIVLTAFNLASSPTRKNPLGSIAAFKAAFGNSRDYLLVMKISGAEDYQHDLHAIMTAIGDAPNIKIMNETLTESDLRGLIKACDITLSLHRAEGFGLIPAAATLLGRPVVATGWSGNLIFMTPETSALVSYRLVKPTDDRGVYAVNEAVWADPDIEDAAARLRQLGADASLRQKLGLAGQDYASQAIGKAPMLAALAANGIA